jgi:hypothetical protein
VRGYGGLSDARSGVRLCSEQAYVPPSLMFSGSPESWSPLHSRTAVLNRVGYWADANEEIGIHNWDAEAS